MRLSMKAALLAVVAVSFCGHDVSTAGPLEDAEPAWARQDYPTAERLYRSAAERGWASAQHFLGKTYENGEGVERNPAEAAKWYALPPNGHSGAQLYLGTLYYLGEGVPRDHVEAYMWFSLSEASGPGESAVQSREKVQKKMSPARIAEAERLRVRSGRSVRDNLAGPVTAVWSRYDGRPKPSLRTRPTARLIHDEWNPAVLAMMAKQTSIAPMPANTPPDPRCPEHKDQAL